MRGVVLGDFVADVAGAAGQPPLVGGAATDPRRSIRVDVGADDLLLPLAVLGQVGEVREDVFGAASVGGKPELLKAAYRLAVRGPANANTPLGQQARSRRISVEPDPHKLLAGCAGVMVEVGRRLAPLYEAVRAAAHADPEARELWHLITEERRTAATGIVRRLAERGALRHGLDRRSASDILWVLNDPGVYQLLVTQRRWTQRRFRAWLTDSMRAQLLEPPAPHA